MTGRHTPEARDLEAMRALGKPYSECHPAEQEAVNTAITMHAMVDLMRSRGAQTVGDLLNPKGNAS